MDGQIEVVVGEDFSPVKAVSDARFRQALAEIVGSLKHEIAAKGGAEAYLRWLRGEDEGTVEFEA